MDKIDKLEQKLDKVTDDVTDVKVDVAEMKTLMKVTYDKVEEHIAGDNKIITKLDPILEQLGEMVADHVYSKAKAKEEKEQRELRTKKWQIVALKLGVVATVVGIVAKVLEII